jgi:Spy/CpxP family protein refolding chaperone
MEINQTSPSKYPNPTMMNKLAKLLPLLAIVIAVPTFAASNHSSFSNHQGQIAEGRRGNYIGNLNLTPEQKTKIEQLRSATRAKMDEVLTSEQRQKLQAIKSQRQANQSNRQGMNLTADQKAKLKAIRQENMAKMKAILTPEQQTQLSQGGGRSGRFYGVGRMARLDKLNLTAEQKTKMQELWTTARSQMQEVLTAEQQQQAQVIKERRQSMRDGWKNLNLTADQKAKLKAIRESSEQQLNSILTPEQQAKRKSHSHGRGYHRM